MRGETSKEKGPISLSFITSKQISAALHSDLVDECLKQFDTIKKNVDHGDLRGIFSKMLENFNIDANAVYKFEFFWKNDSSKEYFIVAKFDGVAEIDSAVNLNFTGRIDYFLQEENPNAANFFAFHAQDAGEDVRRKFNEALSQANAVDDVAHEHEHATTLLPDYVPPATNSDLKVEIPPQNGFWTLPRVGLAGFAALSCLTGLYGVWLMASTAGSSLPMPLAATIISALGGPHIFLAVTVVTCAAASLAAGYLLFKYIDRKQSENQAVLLNDLDDQLHNSTKPANL